MGPLAQAQFDAARVLAYKKDAMIVPHKPSDEAERHAALLSYDVLDSAADPEYDAITALVTAVCAVPIAVVSLVDDDRQWFKSRCGLDASETSRDISFCGHAILKPERIMVVPDAREDERFCDNPLVTGAPGIRFYAGMPLVNSDGYALGTLCVIDTAPRELTDQQLEVLRVAGRAVVTLLEQRRTIARLLRATDELRTEITRRRHVETQLSFSSSHDGLTQLPNRGEFLGRLSSALEDVHADPAKRFAVFFVDLDHFKNINDTLGHLAGDELLVEVGQRLMKIIRSADAVARLGGDEFTMLINGAESEATARSVAERTTSVLGGALRIADVAVKVTASIGVVLVDSSYPSIVDILRDADIAMYASKAAGRNRSTIFTPQLRDQFSRAAELQAAVRFALDNSEFELAYQPVVALQSGERRMAVEALLRWRRPDGTLIGAAQFIESAERCNMIVEIGDWALRQACEQARRWQTEAGQSIVMAVNVSARQLAEPDFALKVKAVLEATGLEPRLLAIEVTETVLIEDIGSSIELLEELRRFGVRVYLDDFGTGYSSLNYLRRFPINKLKIDRSFVSGNNHEGLTDPVIVSSIVSLAHKLNLAVVAEGIETETQLAALTALGCDFAQGYLFSKAVAPDAALACLMSFQERRSVESAA